MKLGEKRIKLQVRRCLSEGVVGALILATVVGYCRAGAVQVRCDCTPELVLCSRGTLRSVTRSYYRGAAGAILVYDITK